MTGYLFPEGLSERRHGPLRRGLSITRFLVDQADRKTFLQFVSDGMKHGWDNAVDPLSDAKRAAVGNRVDRQLEEAALDDGR